jgi:menaquinone-dependent protoporphyrinogen oxidase
MKVLITAATKHGATAEIAATIGGALRDEHGLDAAVVPPEEVATVDGYDAVVLGSAVYAGHWLAPAKELVDRAGRALAGRPVWLFSSGPVGDPPKPEEDPVDVADIVGATKAREHRVFAGKLDKRQLGIGERANRGGAAGPGGGLPRLGRDQGLGVEDRREPRVREAGDARTRASSDDGRGPGRVTAVPDGAAVPALAPALGGDRRRGRVGDAWR